MRQTKRFTLATIWQNLPLPIGDGDKYDDAADADDDGLTFLMTVLKMLMLIADAVADEEY